MKSYKELKEIYKKVQRGEKIPTNIKCLECKKGYYGITNKKDKKGLTLLECNKCGDLAV